MSYRTAVAANALLVGARRHHLRLRPHKLQLLLFLFQGWRLARDGLPAVVEWPQAWAMGPIFESLHQRSQPYGGSTITHFFSVYHPPTDTHRTIFPDWNDVEYWCLLDRIVAEYGRWTEEELVKICADPGGPWGMAMDSGQLLISHESMQSFFRGKFDEYSNFIAEAVAEAGARGQEEGLLLPA